MTAKAMSLKGRGLLESLRSERIHGGIKMETFVSRIFAMEKKKNIVTLGKWWSQGSLIWFQF